MRFCGTFEIQSNEMFTDTTHNRRCRIQQVDSLPVDNIHVPLLGEYSNEPQEAYFSNYHGLFTSEVTQPHTDSD